jgi:hypothetical protein
MFNIFKHTDSSDTQTDTDCAWCLEEEGTLESTSVEGNSHGVCQEHSDQILYNFRLSRFNRVPSYTDRFRDGREAFEDEE